MLAFIWQTPRALRSSAPGLPVPIQCRSLETPLYNKKKNKGKRVRKALPVLAAVAIGFGVLTLPASTEIANLEYAEFLAFHDRLHPPEKAKREPIKVLVRRSFWDHHDRVLLVDARTTQGKGALMIVEGMPGSDWLTAFRITADDGAVFGLNVPDEESVPCEVLVRSGSAFTVTPVQNAPPACDEAEASAEIISRI